MSFTNGQLAQKISNLIQYWSDFNKEYSDWQGGAVDGGPSSDGRYPLTDWYGNELLVKSPAKLQDDVDNIVTGATAQANAAAASAAAAAASESNASTSASTATAQAALADADRVAAELAETNAQDSAVTSTAQANLATDRAGYAQEWAQAAYETPVSVAAGGDGSTDFSALHWAQVAQNFSGSIDTNLYAQLAQNETITGNYTFQMDTIGDFVFRRNGTTGAAGVAFRNDDAAVKGYIGFGDDSYFKIWKGADTSVVFQISDTGNITQVGSITATGAVTGSNLNVSNWDTAYGWGDHGVEGYTTLGGTSFSGTYPLAMDVGSNILYSHNKITFTGNTGLLDITGTISTTGAINAGGAVTGSNLNVSNWDTAYNITARAFNTNSLLNARSTTVPDTTGDSYGITFNYLAQAATPKPAGMTDGALETRSYSSAWQTQTVTDWRNNGRIWIRGQNNGTWTAWEQVWSSADFANNSANWDTAYGWGDHAAGGYAPTASPTFSGTVSMAGALENIASASTSYVARSTGGSASIEVHGTTAAFIDMSLDGTGATDYGARIRYYNDYLSFDGVTSIQINGVEWSTTDIANHDTAYGWGNHAAAGYMTDLVNDTTPQLGGNLSVNGRYITETNHGRTGGQSLWGDGTTTQADWSALPAGVHHFARNTVQYAPVSNYGYFTKVAQRDSGGTGWGGLWVGYSNAENYIGRSTTGPITWERIITDYSTEFTNWNTAYGWGDHASAGYAPTASPTFTGTISGGTFDVGAVVISPQFRLDAASGNGISFWNSASAGTYGIYMSSATDGTWGGRVYGETTSDYNIYFEMNSGTNRGFVFETDNNKLFSINPSGVYADVPQFLISQANGEGDVRLIIEADRNNVGVETDQAELWLAQDGRGVLGYFRTTDSNQLEIGSSATTIGTFTTPVMSWPYNSNAVSMPGSLTVTGNIAAGNIPAYNSFTGGAIVTRHSSGYIFSNYFNQSIGSATSGTETHVPVCTGSDGYFRWKTAANFWKWHSPLHAEELSSSVNLNNLLAANAGFYYQTANADTTGNNYPNAQAGSLLVQKSAGSATQLYITYPTAANKMFFRSYYGSAWGSWNEVITADETQTLSGAKTFSSNPKRSSQGGYLHHNSSSYTDGGITFSTSAASGGTTGDIWFQYT